MSAFTKCIWAWGLIVAGTLAFRVDAQIVTYLHTDALGSIVAESDSNGTVTSRVSYYPYGEVVGVSPQDGPGYGGHVSDSETGLSYMQQRYMDPQLGLFLSVDPVTAYQEPSRQFNRYRYADGNPYTLHDPDGRQAIRKLAEMLSRPMFPIIQRSDGNDPDNRDDPSDPAEDRNGDGRGDGRPEGRPSGRPEAGGEREIRGGRQRTPSPFLPKDPYSPESTSGRQSDNRRDEGAPSKDPDDPIPDRGPGRDQGGHAARGKTPHETGERNVNSNEEHSRRPKGNPTGRSR